MKSHFGMTAALCAALTLASCAGAVPDGPVPEARPLRLVVRALGDGESRATDIVSNDEATEAKVNGLQVLVFDGESLDGYGSSAGSRIATVSCTAGTREIWAVVNAPDLSSVKTRSELLSSVSSLEEDISNFRMTGSRTETISGDSEVRIPVDRLAARVVLRGVRNDHTNASRFRLVSVCLTNAAGDVDYGHSATYEVSRWYNRRGYESGNSLGSFTYDTVGADIARRDTYATAHFFYSMPNAYPAKAGVGEGETGFTPRTARLVVRCEIDGTLYNYPITLPALESNRSYEIELLSITRNGNPDDGRHDPDDPDDRDEEDPVTGLGLGFEVVVNPWSVVLLGDDGDMQI